MLSINSLCNLASPKDLRAELEHELKEEITIPATTFKRFGKLPPEMRQTIWKFAGLEPRVIKVHINRYGNLESDSREQPALTRTCRESRYVVLKFLKPFFHNIQDIENGNVNHHLDDPFVAFTRNQSAAAIEDYSKHILYTNLDIDIFYIPENIDPHDYEELLKGFIVGRRIGIKNLMICGDHPYQFQLPDGTFKPLNNSGKFWHLSLPLSLDLQNLYFIMPAGEKVYATTKDGKLLPYIRRVKARSQNSGTRRSTSRSLDLGHEIVEPSTEMVKQFNEEIFEIERKSRVNKLSKMIRGKKSDYYFKFLEAELERLLNWKMPAIHYLETGSALDTPASILYRSGFPENGV